MTPKISLVAYADRAPGFVFVAVPNERGRYLRTDTSVVLAACPLCEAAIGEPCHNGKKERRYSVNTHHLRRKLADRRSNRAGDVKPRYKLVAGDAQLVAEGIV